MLLAPVSEVVPALTAMFNIEICDWAPFVFHPIVRDHGTITVTAIVLVHLQQIFGTLAAVTHHSSFCLRISMQWSKRA